MPAPIPSVVLHDLTFSWPDGHRVLDAVSGSFPPGSTGLVGLNGVGKSTLLLQAAHNYGERGMEVYLLTARLDTRAGEGRIGSRIGLGREADTFTPEDDLFARIAAKHDARQLACIFVDEAQFLTETQVWQLARVADDLKIPVMAYGLRVDFRGQLFPGSAVLLALADTLREVRTICHCGRKATMVIRKDGEGRVVIDGDQVQIGGNETYISLCRRHWREAFGKG